MKPEKKMYNSDKNYSIKLFIILFHKAHIFLQYRNIKNTNNSLKWIIFCTYTNILQNAHSAKTAADNKPKKYYK